MFYFAVKIYWMSLRLLVLGIWYLKEEYVVIVSWLSTCKADWNGLAIVYKFFWSDPSLWTCLSWPWPLRPLSYWPEAAVYTVCHVHIVNPVNHNSMLFTTRSAYLHIFERNVFWLSVSVCFRFVFFLLFHFLFSWFCSAGLSRVCTSESCTVASFKKWNSNFTVTCHIVLCPSRVNWVRSSQGCWCVSEMRQ